MAQFLYGLIFVNFKMKRFFLCLLLGANFIGPAFSQNANLFDLKLSEFSATAKELSKKNLSEESINSLSNSAFELIEDMRNRAISEKLKAKEIDIQYSDNKQQPSLEGLNKEDEKIIKFFIVCSLLYKYITKEIVIEIVKKSPLEMISIIKELNVFFKFISANPQDFGHGVFTEKQGDKITILATNDAILRIFKVLAYTELLGENCLIYKVSRIGTYLYNNFANVTPESLQAQISKLKRSAIDNSRIALYIPKEAK